MKTTAISPFIFESSQIRVIMVDGEPWFVAKDVCDALGLTNSRMSLMALDADEKGVSSTYTPGGQQEISIINESGLYTLILRCRDAVKQGTLPWRFRKWVTAEVLPSIRKTGNYSQRQTRRTDELNGKDMTNLKHIIHMMTGNFTHNQAWSNAVWFCLRRATGVPSPHPFAVSDLPVLADECRRIMIMTGMLRDFLYTAETTMIKRVLRNGESAEAFIEEMHNGLLDLLRNDTNCRQKLAAFEEKSLRDLRYSLN